MIRNDQIQTAWVAELKSRSNVTTVVTSTEIREDKWKGTNFSYPNIRVKLTKLSPYTPFNDCQVFRSELTILVIGEEKSSKSVDEIAGIVATEFWGKGFTNSGVKVTKVGLMSIIPSYVPEDWDAWVSEVNFECLVQSA